MRGYNDFSSVEEFKRYYHLITEDKEESLGSELPAEEAESISKYNNIFKHIIVFTNDRDPKDNKTLKNIYEAIENLKKDHCDTIPELHIFVAAKMDADEDEEVIHLYDDKEEYTISSESNTETLVFARLGVQGEDQCEHVVKLLQDRGFLVLNPVKYSAIACDKYESALLFQNGEIPQPRFTLMTKSILYDEKSFLEAMRDVYPKWDAKDNNKNEDFDCVVKILDGHGGTGVAVIDGKRLLAWLQMIFAINPDQRLLIQKKEEADGGDIRVHVLTLREKQVILAAMKRVKLGGDFRSNVSLGATAEPVKLTKEQKEIALKTAKLSKLPWCAVDIMPLVKGSNKELGDNVVLEINASPGTAGISEVIKENFINILLNELDDPGEFVLQDKNAGYIESVELDFGNITKTYLAKLDTGNSGLASTLEVGEFTDDGKMLKFKIDGKSISLKKEGEIKIVAGDESYTRPYGIIKSMKVGLRVVKNIKLAIVKSRDKKSTNILLNRDVISKLGYVVHPASTHLLTPEMEKIKIV